MALNNLQNNTVTSVYESTDSTPQKSTTSNTNTGFSSLLAQSSPTSTASTKAVSTNWLTTQANSDRHRPNVKQFMDATGLSANDASEFIYGVVGSNTDTRDWQAILSSSDPVSAIRSATNAMYNQSTPSDAALASEKPHHLKPLATVAKSGNFAITQQFDDQDLVKTTELKLVSSDGLVLRDAGNTAEAIQRNAWLFGLDTAPLNTLATAAPSQLQNPMSQVESLPVYQPANSDLNESIDSFFKSVGADAANLLKKLALN